MSQLWRQCIHRSLLYTTSLSLSDDCTNHRCKVSRLPHHEGCKLPVHVNSKWNRIQQQNKIATTAGFENNEHGLGWHLQCNSLNICNSHLTSAPSPSMRSSDNQSIGKSTCAVTTKGMMGSLEDKSRCSPVFLSSRPQHQQGPGCYRLLQRIAEVKKLSQFQHFIIRNAIVLISTKPSFLQQPVMPQDYIRTSKLLHWSSFTDATKISPAKWEIELRKPQRRCHCLQALQSWL